MKRKDIEMFIKEFGIYIKEPTFNEDGSFKKMQDCTCEECWWYHEWTCGYYPIHYVEEDNPQDGREYNRKSTSHLNTACSKFLPMAELVKQLESTYKKEKNR